MTKDDIIGVLSQSFPCVKLRMTDRIGGCLITFTTWNFKFEASLTTKVLGAIDEKGQATLIFKYHDENSKISYSLGTMSGKDIQTLLDFVEWVRTYMLNTMGALKLSMKPKEP